MASESASLSGIIDRWVIGIDLENSRRFSNAAPSTGVGSSGE